MGLAVDFVELLTSPLLSRFKVFADYEDYIKCQEKVSNLYKVRGPGPGLGRSWAVLARMREKMGILLAE